MPNLSAHDQALTMVASFFPAIQGHISMALDANAGPCYPA